MSQSRVYSFATAEGLTKYVDDNDFVNSGTWSMFGTYYSDPYQAVSYGASQYLCVTTNTGRIPSQQPTRWNPTRYWSPLVLLYEYSSGTTAPTDTALLAQSAYNLAAIGTNTGTAAYLLAESGSNLAQAAFDIAVAGTNLAQAAFDIAVQGTNAVIDETGSRIAADDLLQAQIGTVAGDVAAMQAQLSVGLSGSHLVFVAGSYGGEAILGLWLVNGIATAIWEYH